MSSSSINYAQLREKYSVNWPQATFLVVTPLIALWSIFNVELHRYTAIWAFVYYIITGLGITAGYHRLWAHKAYDAALPYQVWMALAGAGAAEGSIRWWSRGHRAHHRYTDTEKDPYSAHRGLFWAHIGWMLVKPNHVKDVALGKVDMSDLDADKLVRWQHRNYVPLALTMAFAFPSIVAGLFWGDWLGGFLFAGVARLVFVHHATFCVNSLAHYLGNATYDDERTPRDHWFTALVTFGEGNHNWHHTFPNDYRNGKPFEYDPTKWVIYVCSLLGITYNLVRFPENEIQKGELQMTEKRCKEWRHRLDWGVDLEHLPEWDLERYSEELKLNPEMVVIDGVAHDVSRFVNDHPGGVKLLKMYFGKDASKAFNGAVYKHSNIARNFLTRLRVAKVQGLQPVLIPEDELYATTSPKVAVAAESS